MVVGGHRQHSRYSPSIERQMMPSQVINVPYRKTTPTNQRMAVTVPRDRSRERVVQTTIGGPMPTTAGNGGHDYRHPSPHHLSSSPHHHPHPHPHPQHNNPHHHVVSLNEMPEKSRVSNVRSGVTSHSGAVAEERHHELECDYDTSATQLYELLESSDWERARSRCRSHPEEVRTWIVRKDKSQQVRWKLLPLHAAIIFQAPSSVVSSLLERYPAAASRKDDQGMLPLHLAFRHKQEDEDLLEVLLVQYPQAVMLRDRRDRVPLEHGRDSRYSARLMRLFGEATTDASAALNPKKHGTAGMTASHNTTTTDSLTHSLSHSQLARLEAEHEAKMAVVKADYEYQLKTMQGKYEDRIHAIQDKTNAAIREADLAASDKQQKLIDQHGDEVNELRELLQRQVNKDKAVSDSLQREVSHLQNSLNDAKAQSEILNERYNQLVADNGQLRDFLDTICEDQAMIQEIASKQQDYLEAARSIRSELVQTLLKQEDADGQNDRMRGTKLLEITNSVQRRIHDFVETNLNHNNPRNSHPTTPIASTPRQTAPAVEAYHVESPRMTSPRHRMNTNDYVMNTPNNSKEAEMGSKGLPSDRKGPSRIEVERGDDDGEGDLMYSTDQQGQTEVQAYYVVQGEDAGAAAGASGHHPPPGGGGGANGVGGVGDHHPEQEEYAAEVAQQDVRQPQQQQQQQEDNYGEVRILGDEISAITENSAY